MLFFISNTPSPLLAPRQYLSGKNKQWLLCRDAEAANTPEDASTGGENKSAAGKEPQAKKRKIFPNDPNKVESPEAGVACVLPFQSLCCGVASTSLL